MPVRRALPTLTDLRDASQADITLRTPGAALALASEVGLTPGAAGGRDTVPRTRDAVIRWILARRCVTLAAARRRRTVVREKIKEGHDALAVLPKHGCDLPKNAGDCHELLGRVLPVGLFDVGARAVVVTETEVLDRLRDRSGLSNARALKLFVER